MSFREQKPFGINFILVFALLGGILSPGFVSRLFGGPDQPTRLSLAANESQSKLALQIGFPSTSTLDNFTRANGALGANWSGLTSGYAIAGNKVDVNSGGDIYWNANSMGVDQEAYVTLSTIDPNGEEIALVLKAQSNSSFTSGLIEVLYNSPGHYIEVWTYVSTPEHWQPHGTQIPVTFLNGDQLGARAGANGQVEIYKNGVLLGVRDVTDWPFYSNSGYIGLFFKNASNTSVDDFGGGTLSNSPPLTPTSLPCTDPTTCNPVSAISSYWRCNIPSCNGADWVGAVISWPSWSAYSNNARSGNNSRTVYSFSGETLFSYMGPWAEGCKVTAVSGTVLIIEWRRGTDVWRETYLTPGQSHTIDLTAPEDNAMIEAPDGLTAFSVSLDNCTPQNITGTSTSTRTATATASPTATSTPTSTATATNAPTHTATPTATSSPTASNTPTYTHTSAPTGDKDTTGVFRPSNGLLFLKNSNSTGFADAALNYGLPGDYPVVGDWDGNGTVTIGIYRSGRFYLKNANALGFAEIVFPFGQPGDQPVAGDWDGDGVDTIGVYRPSIGQFLLRNSNTEGTADASFFLGNPGDVGVAGDWDGDGKDSTGVFRPSNGVIFLKDTNDTGFANYALNYGLPGDQPVMGDWNNDGKDTIGIYRNGTFYLRNSNTNGFAEIVFGLGNPGDMPIAGNWDGIP
jgi:hypothetical protein